MKCRIFRVKIGKKFWFKERYQVADKPNRYKAVIDGRTYTIVGRKSQEHMKTVTELVDAELAELKKVTKNLKDEDRAILLAVNTKSEQVELQKKVIQLQEKLESLNAQI